MLLENWLRERHRVFGRSMSDLVRTLDDLKAAGIDLYLHGQGLDTSTPTGKALFGMLGVFAEFERSMIVARVKAGLERARATGTRTGNPFGRPSLSIRKTEIAVPRSPTAPVCARLRRWRGSAKAQPGSWLWGWRLPMSRFANDRELNRRHAPNRQ